MGAPPVQRGKAKMMKTKMTDDGSGNDTEKAMPLVSHTQSTIAGDVRVYADRSLLIAGEYEGKAAEGSVGRAGFGCSGHESAADTAPRVGDEGGTLALLGEKHIAQCKRMGGREESMKT